ncbi:MAG TPA: glutathione S-transferase family protein [Pseudoxanthomonas sp.]|nr:glutathione S-transferase family protein [Pseudoxanthomonas sp.]
MSQTLTLFHNPQSRSAGVRVLLEALGAPYEVRLIDLKVGQQRQPEFLAINPMGKLPTLRDGDAVVTEQVAIYLYLADRFPQAGLAPALESPLRGPYLRWMAFYGSCFEPAVVDRAMKREAVDPMTSPYGDFDTMLKVLTDQLERGPYLLGEQMNAADILWGSALRWTTGWDLVPKLPAIAAYIERVCAHPAFARAMELDSAGR